MYLNDGHIYKDVGNLYTLKHKLKLLASQQCTFTGVTNTDIKTDIHVNLLVRPL